MQPTFKQFFPYAVVVGILAALTVYLSATLSGAWAPAGAVWVPFIAWALYFAGGAKFSRMHKYAIGLVGGAAFGWITLVGNSAIMGIVGGTLSLPVTVFFVAIAILLLELTDWFEYAPAYFFGYASYFAYLFGGFPGASEGQVTALVNTSILLLVGLGIGYVSATLRGKVLDLTHTPPEQRQTIFDKG